MGAEPATLATAPARLIRLPGLTPYAEANDLQHDLARRRLAGEVPDCLLLLEHPAVYTAGKRWRPEHFVADIDRLTAGEAAVHFIDRGGSVTFHGPGQLVAYPIIDLGIRPDVARYVHDLEEVVIQACAAAGIEGLGRDPANSGVWAGARKVCAIGVRVMRMRVTLHGFALNCSTDLRWYDAIVPCGLGDRGVTTLSELAGRVVAVEEMVPLVARAFERVFRVTWPRATDPHGHPPPEGSGKDAGRVDRHRGQRDRRQRER